MIYLILLSSFSFSIEDKNKSYKSFDYILSTYVDSLGNVNYNGIINNPYSFNDFLLFIENVSPDNNPEYFKTIDEEIAYWINTYNALVLKIMIDNPNISSILDVSNYFIFMKKFNIGGKKISLSKIENKILRNKYKDPRIHFAINCGSVSCPPLSARIFKGETLNNQLEKKTYNYLNQPHNVKINHALQEIYLNKIFKWYKKDFGNIHQFICKYLNNLDYQKIKNYKIKYDFYDWSSNAINK